jgi:hypothetical protein
MRRLSLAAEELRRTDDKIIDIALKYGYDTPESFSRAFTRFHGVTPTDARHGAGNSWQASSDKHITNCASDFFIHFCPIKKILKSIRLVLCYAKNSAQQLLVERE